MRANSVLSWIAQRGSERGGVFASVRLLRAAARLAPSPWVRVRQRGMEFFFDCSDRFQAMMAVGVYEPELEDLVRKALRSEDTYLDVGAQLGYTASAAAAVLGGKGRVVLFEPDPRAFERLQKTVQSQARPDAPTITLVQAACSDREGTLEFSLADTLGHSRIRPHAPAAEQDRASKTVSVPTVVLDEWLAQNGVATIRFLKLDVEGHELSVLRGLQRTLSEGRIECLVIEKNTVLLEDNGYSPSHLYAALRRHGYHAVSLERRVPVEAKDFSTDLLENWVFARQGALFADLGFLAQSATAGALIFEDLARLVGELDDPNQVAIQAARLIAKARAGNVEEAIRQGQELLSAHPDLTQFRGHLAHWLRTAGRREEALEHYQMMARHDPQDDAVRRILEELEAETAGR